MAKTPLIGTFDLETDPFLRGREPLPFSGDVFTGDHHSTWWGADCAKKVCEYICRHARIWYAHNGGKFDFHLILRFIPKKRIKKVLCIGGRIVQIVFHSLRGVIHELRDSYALIPRALREWAKDDIEIWKLEKEHRETYKDEIIKYEKGDTEHLYDMVTAFIGSYGMFLTLASAAFKILHKQFGVKHSRLSEQQDAKFRRFYFAGRVEFYALGNLGGDFKCVDINSSFPYSMTKPHWEGDEYITLSRLPTKNLEQSFIHCECESRGAFPHRDEDGGVSFPDDGVRRHFFVTGWEWVAALDLGLLVRAVIVSCFTPVSKRDYKEYIEHFYRIKENAERSGDKGERLFAKLLMNSGYGKFGMDPREHEEMMICDWREKPDGENWSILKDDPENGITIYKRPTESTHNKFNNVCVAASITGCSRALLLRARQNCGGVAYCDTDSLIAKDISKLSLGSNLGQWKLEHTFSEFYIGGKKLYAGYDSDAINPKTKEKGYWKTASKGARLSPEQIKSVASGLDIVYEFDAPSYSVRDILSEKDGGKPGATKWLRFTKRTIRRADKMKSYETRHHTIKDFTSPN